MEFNSRGVYKAAYTTECHCRRPPPASANTVPGDGHQHATAATANGTLNDNGATTASGSATASSSWCCQAEDTLWHYHRRLTNSNRVQGPAAYSNVPHDVNVTHVFDHRVGAVVEFRASGLAQPPQVSDQERVRLARRTRGLGEGWVGLDPQADLEGGPEADPVAGSPPQAGSSFGFGDNAASPFAPIC
jgi:hypothetical protein